MTCTGSRAASTTPTSDPGQHPDVRCKAGTTPAATRTPPTAPTTRASSGRRPMLRITDAVSADVRDDGGHTAERRRCRAPPRRRPRSAGRAASARAVDTLVPGRASRRARARLADGPGAGDPTAARTGTSRRRPNTLFMVQGTSRPEAPCAAKRLRRPAPALAARHARAQHGFRAAPGADRDRAAAVQLEPRRSRARSRSATSRPSARPSSPGSRSSRRGSGAGRRRRGSTCRCPGDWSRKRSGRNAYGSG